VYSVEAQIPHTQNFAHNFQKIFLFYIKYFYKTILVFANSILCSVLSLDKIIFENYHILKNIFTNCFDLLRSTGRSTGFVSGQNDRPTGRPQFWPLGVCMCARYPVDRVVDRTPYRSTDLWLTESTLVSVWDGRPGGRPWPGKGQMFLKTGRPAGWPWAFSQPKQLVF